MKDKIENITLDEFHHSVNIPLLKKQLSFAIENSLFWKEWFKDIDIKNFDVHADFHRLPLCDKADILNDQIKTPPFGNLLSVDTNRVARLHRTSGTTNQPFLVLLTENDIKNTVLVGTRAFRCSGVTPDDIVVHCLNYCMWSGGITDHQCLEGTGAMVIPFGVGNSKYLIQTIKRIHPTAISCTPSYLGRLEELLIDEFKMQPRDLGLKIGLFGGELGMQDPGYRLSIEEKWGIQCIDANYGLSEVLSIIGSECSFKRGLHYHAQGILMPELVDQEMNNRPLEKGSSGELVLTCLRREAQPLFRYRTHDIIEIVDTDMCECGREDFLFKILGRTDDMIVVKGVNFFPSSIQGVLCKFNNLFSGEYRIILESGIISVLQLEIELLKSVKMEDLSGIKKHIQDIIKSEHSVKVEIEFVSYGTIPKSENKMKRVVKV